MPLFACFLRWYRCVPCTDALCQRIGRVRAIYFSFCACISASVSAFVSVWFAPGIQQVIKRLDLPKHAPGLQNLTKFELGR